MSAISKHQHYTSYFSGNSQPVSGRGQGGLVLAGGGPDVDEAMRWLVDRGGGGDVVVLRASGEDGYNDYLLDLTRCNSVQTLVFHDREGAFEPEVVEAIQGAESVFIAGGNQSKYLQFWSQTPLQESLQQAVEKGVPLGGTSAGLAVLGQEIFTSHQGSPSSQEVLQEPTSPMVDLAPAWLSLPPMQGIVTDTHFSQRERMGRLVSFLAAANQAGESQREPMRGLGVDEATALLVDPRGRGQVVGSHEVYLITPGGGPQERTPGKPLTYEDLSVLRLASGEEVRLGEGSSPQQRPYRLDVREGRLYQ